MAYKASFELHHHFPKLAEEAGFTFNTHRPRIHIDWNKIRLINIDSLIKERKFYIIEQHLNDILDCVFESEFDVRILDEGVLKIFRLAQLAVEYQQFCRHYLDRSVYVLREEVTSLAQQLDACKKDLREKDDELRKLKKRSRHYYKTSNIPYNNDNIATMILKTLSHKGDMIPSPSNDTMQYNKCSYCEKIFLNQLYLKSHISRRHGNVLESPQKDKDEYNLNNDNTKLSVEVTELRNKIKEMEIIFANTNNQVNNHLTVTEDKSKDTFINEISKSTNSTKELKKDMQYAEVSTNNEEYLLNRIEEWKKEEYANYNKEMDKLRSQIIETINTIKEKDNQKSVSIEPSMIAQLHETIKQQGAEILALKDELNDSRIKVEKENIVRSREHENQIKFWSNRAEAQSKQYELLLQKLNNVAEDARESRTIAEAERDRAEQLKILLQQSLNSKSNEIVEITNGEVTPDSKSNNTNVRKRPPKMQHLKSTKVNQEADRNSLENLHRKAQELLDMASVTTTSSDSSSIDDLKQKIDMNIDDQPTRLNKYHKMPNSDSVSKLKTVENKPHTAISHKSNSSMNKIRSKVKKGKLKNNHKHSSNTLKENNGPILLPPGSPMKLVRAKITEEVNTRLASVGVDPLKSRLPKSMFQKQRIQLRQQQELKDKKTPINDKVRHKILTLLDSSTTVYKNEVAEVPDCTYRIKNQNTFKNLTSAISNVKTKALSLVKLNETHKKEKQRSKNDDVTKRAMTLLKTPPGSALTSPIMTGHSPLKAFTVSHNDHGKIETIKINQDIKNTPLKLKKSSSPKNDQQTLPTSVSEDISEESDFQYYTTSTQQSSKSIETLIKSPARRPSSAGSGYNHIVQKFTISDGNILRTQSATNLAQYINNKEDTHKASTSKQLIPNNNSNSSDEVESLLDVPAKTNAMDGNVENIVKQTKSVLKNASSMSSLNKKKVLFDMDAIQMKSVSASPSQSLTEKSEGNEKYELGLVNLDGEEWDISSIENEPLKDDTKIQNVTRTSPKIAELKDKIESQLARRNEPPKTLAGRVDLLSGTMIKAGSTGGSNTSLGSSILDDSEIVTMGNHKTVVKPKRVTAKDDSDIEISEFSIDGIVNKNESF